MDRIKRIRSMLGRIFRIRPSNTEARVTLIVAAAGTCLQFAIIAAIRGIPGISPNDLWLLLPSSFPMWVIANILRNVIDERRYGGLREGWKEIEVFWQPSDVPMLGVGDGYPREPVIVVSSQRSGFPEKGLFGEPLYALYFNNGIRAKPIPGEPEYWQNRWGELEYRRVQSVFGERQAVRFTQTAYLVANPDSDKP